MSAALTGERAVQMTEHLHATWHPAPGGCTAPCPELARATAAVRALGPLLVQYVAEEVERAEHAIREAWGQ